MERVGRMTKFSRGPAELLFRASVPSPGSNHANRLNTRYKEFNNAAIVDLENPFRYLKLLFGETVAESIII